MRATVTPFSTLTRNRPRTSPRRAPHAGVADPQLANRVRTDEEEVPLDRQRQTLPLALGDDQVDLHRLIPRVRCTCPRQDNPRIVPPPGLRRQGENRLTKLHFIR